MRRLVRLPSRRRPFVLDLQAQDIRVEGGDKLLSSGGLGRVAVVAHWAVDSRVSRSVAALVDALIGHGYQVVLASSAEAQSPLEWPRELPANVTLLRRPNLGYDFGSWATALARYPQILAAPQVLLVNDSLAGPFRPMDHLLAKFDESAADVWGLTDTSQFAHHLQSYCLGFKGGCLAEPPLAQFWRSIRVERSRDDVIWRYEIGLSRLLRLEHFSIDAAFRYSRVVEEGRNPTIIGWRGLLDLGFPFVKRQILSHPEVAPDGATVRKEIQRRFGVDVDEWL